MILKGLESAIVTLAEEISPNRVIYRNFIKKTLEKNMTVPVPIMPWVSSAPSGISPYSGQRQRLANAVCELILWD